MSAGTSKGESVMKELKKQKRREIKAITDRLSESYKHEASEEICDALLGMDEYRRAETVMCYLNMDGEPETGRMIAQMLADGKRVCIPLCVDKTEHLMVAKVFSEELELVPGAYGILEPVADADEAEPSEIDLVVAPCVSCTRDCLRIGHGAGYYDRYLARTSCPVVALCFEQVISEELPVDEYDRPMDAVVSEKKIYTK